MAQQSHTPTHTVNLYVPSVEYKQIPEAMYRCISMIATTTTINPFFCLCFSLSLLVGLLQKTFLLGELLGLVVDGRKLLLGHLTTLTDVSLDNLVRLGHLRINKDLVINIDAGYGKERDQDHGYQARCREPAAKSPDHVEDTNILEKVRRSDRVVRESNLNAVVLSSIGLPFGGKVYLP